MNDSTSRAGSLDLDHGGLSTPWLFCPRCRRVREPDGRCRGPDCSQLVDPTRLSARGPISLADAVGGGLRILARPVFVALAEGSGILVVSFRGEGQSNRRGGILGLDADCLELRWIYDAGAAVEAAASVVRLRGGGVRLVVGDAAGHVHCLGVDVSGQLVSERKSESIDGATIEHAPLVGNDGFAWVGTVEGYAACVHIPQCQIIARRRVVRSDGGSVRLAAPPVFGPDQALWWATYEISDHLRYGSIVRMEARSLNELGRIELPAHTYVMPIFPRSGHTPVVALADGRIGRITRSGGVELAAWQTDAGRMIRHAPAVTREGEIYEGETLWIPTHDHRLVVMDLQNLEARWDVNIGRSLVATPLVVPNARLVIVADNIGMLHAYDVDRQDQGPVWRHDLQSTERTGSSSMGNPGPAALDGLAFGNGEVFAAASNGSIAAVPWHGGRLDWAAAYLESQGQYEGAAAFAVRASATIGLGAMAVRPGAQGLHSPSMAPRDLVSRLSDNAGVARPALLEHLGRLEDAAEAYERCELWTQAMRVWRLVGRPFKVRRCFLEHCRAKGFPAVEVVRDALDFDLQEGEDGRVALRLLNNGAQPAADVRITLKLGQFVKETRLGWLGPGRESRVEFNHVEVRRPGRAVLGVLVEHAGSTIHLEAAGGRPDDLLWTFDVDVLPAPAAQQVFTGPVLQAPGNTVNNLVDSVQTNRSQGRSPVGESTSEPTEAPSDDPDGPKAE